MTGCNSAASLATGRITVAPKTELCRYYMHAGGWESRLQNLTSRELSLLPHLIFCSSSCECLEKMLLGVCLRRVCDRLYCQVTQFFLFVCVCKDASEGARAISLTASESFSWHSEFQDLHSRKSNKDTRATLIQESFRRWHRYKDDYVPFWCVEDFRVFYTMAVALSNAIDMP